MKRLIAIGDVHGYLTALDALLRAIGPRPGDTIVMLGDYVDRGPDSRGVIDRLIVLKQQCRLVPLLGNHDELLLDICNGRTELIGEWLMYGGDTTVASYDSNVPDGVPRQHVDFLKECLPYYESDHHFFVHANYYSNLTLEQQPREALYWESLRDREPFPHCSGKTAVVGHTAQKNGEIFDLGYLKCIDTCIYGDGWLTAIDLGSGQVWQVDKEGGRR